MPPRMNSGPHINRVSDRTDQVDRDKLPVLGLHDQQGAPLHPAPVTVRGFEINQRIPLPVVVQVEARILIARLRRGRLFFQKTAYGSHKNIIAGVGLGRGKRKKLRPFL